MSGLATKACSALATLLLACSAVAAGEPGVMTIKPRLSKGDSFTLQISRGRQQTGGGRQVSGRATFLADVAVLEAGDEGYVISCTYRKARVEGAEAEQVAANPAAKIMLEMWNNIPLHLKVSPEYAVVGLANYDEVRKAADASIAKMLTAMGRDPEKDPMRATLGRVLSSERMVSQLLARELTLYLSFTGDFKLGDEGTASAVEFPAPFGRETLPGKSETRVEKVDNDAATAVIVRTSSVDGEALRGNLPRGLNELDRKAGKEPQPGRRLPEMTMHDTTRAVVDLETQLPKSVQFDRTVTMPPKTRIDSIAVRRLPAGSDFQDETPKGPQPAQGDAKKDAPAETAK